MSIAHNQKILDRYANNLDEIFHKISECEKDKLNINEILKYPISHVPFSRLN